MKLSNRIRLLAVCCLPLLIMTGYAQNGSTAYYVVSGTVKDDAGKAIPDAQVQAFIRWAGDSVSGSGGSAHAIRYTDKDGSYTLHLPANGVALVSANSPGLVTDYKVLEQSVSKLNFVLKSHGRTLSGTVVDQQGNPVPHAHVAVDAVVPSDEPQMAIKRLLLGSHFNFDLIADEKGFIRIEDLPALPVRIYSVSPEAKEELQQLFRETLKEPTADLTAGDAVNLTITADKI